MGAFVGPFCGQSRAQIPAPETAPPAANNLPPTANNPPPTAPDANAVQGAPTTPFGIPLPGAPAGQQAPTNGAYAGGSLAKTQTRRAALEARMRDMMTRLGIHSLPTQDAILGFMSADEDGKKSVREAGRKLLVGVRREAPPERLKALLSDYQNSLDTERSRREAAQTALDARVGYSLDARLESLLWLLGVLGEGQSAFGPAAFELDTGAKRARTDSPAVTSSEAQTSEMDGVVTAKSGADEPQAWLEIRDGNGRVWRLKSDGTPAARRILNRQVGEIPIGAHISARVGVPVPVPTLLAIIPDEGAQNAPGAGAPVPNQALAPIPAPGAPATP